MAALFNARVLKPLSCPDPEMWLLVHIVDLVGDPRKPQLGGGEESGRGWGLAEEAATSGVSGRYYALASELSLSEVSRALKN